MNHESEERIGTNLTEEDIKKQEDFNAEIIPHLDATYNYALRLTTDPNDAEDLLQDSIVKAFRFFSSYQKGTNARAWLYRIVKNSYINNYRKASRQPQKVDYDEVATYYETVRSEQSDTTDLQAQFYRNEYDDDFKKALDNLPEDFRTPLLLCDVEDFTYEEIANMLDVPIGTVRSRLHRGRNLLKEKISQIAEKRGYLKN
ncbi:sigma-70 family RNA polymerase sigma factor [Balneolaceae bacterium ANBcel3]|nr:sigma-70 family RNA polymerase sigma factor [Balneolaceae bacterium ANBcel3]